MTVYLVDAVGPVEREVVEAWVRERGAGSEMVPLTVPDIAARLRRGDDPLLAPVRVTWLPADGRRPSPDGCSTPPPCAIRGVPGCESSGGSWRRTPAAARSWPASPPPWASCATG